LLLFLACFNFNFSHNLSSIAYNRVRDLLYAGFFKPCRPNLAVKFIQFIRLMEFYHGKK